VQPIANPGLNEGFSKSHVLCPICRNIVQSSKLLSPRRPPWHIRDFPPQLINSGKLKEYFSHYSTRSELRESAGREYQLCALIFSAMPDAYPDFNPITADKSKGVELVVAVRRGVNALIFDLWVAVLFGSLLVYLRRYVSF